ncbi:MAG TPA: major capsid protein [Armatimonadota bacterium]|nr:major capsid protein [Armatimonadota bacterium]
MATFVYPSSAELKEVEQEKLPKLTQDDPIFTLMPAVNVDAHLLEWEQEDNWVGLQQVRGLGGAPGRVARVGAKRYKVEPGVYGEFVRIDEVELTTRRQYGSFNAPIDLTDLVMRAQDQLLARRIDRLRYIGWTLLTTGTYSVADPSNQVLHTDTFSLQTYGGSDWSTAATSTPIADFRAMALQGRGKGVSFGAGARAFANRVTVNRLLANSNAADIGGKLVVAGNNVVSLSDANRVLLANDLPALETYDEGYLDNNGTFQPFIADDKVVVIGKRSSGSPIMDYAMTRNANNPNLAPGVYTKVDDDPNRVPRFIDVHDGHNGGPRIYFPSAIVIMSV